MRLLLLCLCTSLTLAQELEIGKLMLLSFRGDRPPLEQLSEFRPAGFLFYPSNITSTQNTRELIKTLQQQADYPLLFGIDQEGGPFNAYRVESATLFPGQMALAATQNPNLATQVATALAKEVGYMGFNLLFAPVVDVNSNPENPIIGIRSFSSDPNMVSLFTRAYLQGLKQANIIAVAKHFPGHGDTSLDSHLGLPVIQADRIRLENLELIPFKTAINAGVPAIMTAHVVFSALDSQPATLSRTILTDLLRTELGFQGLIVTDFMDMKAISDHYGAGEAAVRSIEAGADLLLLGPSLERQREVYQALQEALDSGRLSPSRVREALKRAQTLAAHHQMNIAQPDYSAHQTLAQQVAHQSVTLLYNDGILPLRQNVRLLVLAPRLLQYGEPPLLGEVLAKYHPQVISQQIAENPTQTDLHMALEAAQQADVILLASHHWQGPFPESLSYLQAELAATGKPLIAVALGNPDDWRFFTVPANAYLATYSFWGSSLEALSQVLLGFQLPQGTLPVAVGVWPVGSGIKRF